MNEVMTLLTSVSGHALVKSFKGNSGHQPFTLVRSQKYDHLSSQTSKLLASASMADNGMIGVHGRFV